jgi:predicted DNA-binding transcriptional regulator AlpA
MPDEKVMPPRLLRLREVLSILDISRSTYYELRKTGQVRLATVRLGGAIRFRPADVEAEVRRRLR